MTYLNIKGLTSKFREKEVSVGGYGSALTLAR